MDSVSDGAENVNEPPSFFQLGASSLLHCRICGKLGAPLNSSIAIPTPSRHKRDSQIQGGAFVAHSLPALYTEGPPRSRNGQKGRSFLVGAL